MTEDIRNTLGSKHHALLFAWMSREVIQRVGEKKGEAVIRKAVQHYGRQRGGRMAMRALADGKEPSMFNFLVYGEWEGRKGESARLILDTAPDFHVKVKRCPWNDAWVENDLLPYGSLYCLEVDHALIQGYNSDLKLGLGTTLANDQEDCDFLFQGANLTPENFKRMEQRRAEVHDNAVMPWEYHLGHLYKTISEDVIDALGDVGEEAMIAAMAEFTKAFGVEAAQIVMAYRETDFDSLP